MRYPSVVLGVDIGHYSLKIIQTKHSRQGEVSIESIAHFPLSCYNDEIQGTGTPAKLLLGYLNSLSTQPDVINLCVATGDTHIDAVSVRSGLSSEELEGLVHVELTKRLPFPLRDAFFDFALMNGDEDFGDSTLLVVAVQKSIVERMLSVLPSNKRLQATVDISVFVLSDMISAHGSSTQRGSYAIIDIGHQKTRYYMFHDSQLVRYQEVCFGGDTLNNIIAKHTAGTCAQAEQDKHKGDVSADVLAEYHQYGKACFTELLVGDDAEVVPERVCLIGGGAQLVGFFEPLINDIGDCQVVPLAFFGNDVLTALDGQESMFATALALAYKPIDGERLVIL